MDPIDRVRARADALAELGVDKNADTEEIRQAWRRIAFEAHPDHGASDTIGFSRAKAAYDLLRAETREAGLQAMRRAATAAVRRPAIRTRIVDLTEEERLACAALLSESANSAETAAFEDAIAVRDADVIPTSMSIDTRDHVPGAVSCRGRSLTYCVPSHFRTGLNRIAVPPSVLVNAREDRPKILTFRAPRAGSGEFSVPVEMLSRLFPGARSVSIRFLARH